MTTNEHQPPTPIAEGQGWTFWLVGGAVYRAPTGAALDTAGLPLGKRWECDRAQWLRFRDSVFAWAEDLAAPRVGQFLSTKLAQNA